jgi:hypothetical protein
LDGILSFAGTGVRSEAAAYCRSLLHEKRTRLPPVAGATLAVEGAIMAEQREHTPHRRDAEPPSSPNAPTPGAGRRQPLPDDEIEERELLRGMDEAIAELRRQGKIPPA